ncbi:MAG: hypothetical protein EAZ29_03075 [Runella slithyformis]|nr:MAG: hypothetical protein EAZ29_03075 [Runella slithyformis]
MREAPVAPFDHITVPAQLLAVSVTDSPMQMLFDEQSKVGAATLVTTIVTGLDAALFTPGVQTHTAV